MSGKIAKAKSQQVILHVPPGHTKNVKIVETDPEARGADISVQVSRTRKPSVSRAIGVIVK